ncbi:hypothetical protein V1478_009679, partial [Vespula squamosa]
MEKRKEENTSEVVTQFTTTRCALRESVALFNIDKHYLSIDDRFRNSYRLSQLSQLKIMESIKQNITWVTSRNDVRSLVTKFSCIKIKIDHEIFKRNVTPNAEIDRSDDICKTKITSFIACKNLLRPLTRSFKKNLS